MIGKRLVKRMAAALAVAGCAFVVIVSLGATVFYALQLLVTPLAASALTALIFAVLAGIIGAVFLGKAGGYGDPEEDVEPLHVHPHGRGRSRGVGLRLWRCGGGRGGIGQACGWRGGTQ